MAKPPVKIFSLSTCSHCKSTKRLLNDCTVKFDFVDVDLLKGEERKETIEEVKKFQPKVFLPDDHYRGQSELWGTRKKRSRRRWAFNGSGKTL